MSLLPNESQVNPSSAFWAPGVASGGGGGGGGANIVCSTLTAANGISSAGDVSLNANLAFPTGVVGSEATLGINLISGYVNPIAGEGDRLLSTEITTTAGTVYAPLGVGSLEVIGITSGGVVPGVRITSDAQGSLFCQAPSSIQCQAISSINFSTPSLTLNGAPIGGGAPDPNPSLSSISFNSNAALNVIDSLIIANIATPVTNDISFLTNQSANSVVTNVQPGGVGSVVAISPATGSGTNLNLAGTDVGGAILASAVNATGAPSTLTVSCDNFKLAQPNTLDATFNIFGTDTNLFALQVTDSNAALVTGVDIGLVGGRNQVYINSNAQIQNDLWVSSISKCAAATVSSFTVSSINGAAPGGGLTNFTIPFITGSGDGSTWTINVDSNTGGIPVALTSTLVVSPANSYLVNYSLFGGSNSDTAQYTKLSVYTASGSGSPIIQTCPGLVSDNWLSNGFMGARSLIVSGASAIRLQAEDYSPTVSTTLYFDQQTSFKVTNLGASS